MKGKVNNRLMEIALEIDNIQDRLIPGCYGRIGVLITKGSLLSDGKIIDLVSDYHKMKQTQEDLYKEYNELKNFEEA